jgi:hypothetical protein
MFLQGFRIHKMFLQNFEFTRCSYKAGCAAHFRFRLKRGKCERKIPSETGAPYSMVFVIRWVQVPQPVSGEYFQTVFIIREPFQDLEPVKVLNSYVDLELSIMSKKINSIL